MTESRMNRELLIKYCKIMLNKMDNSEDQERMAKWLEAVTNSKCDKEVSYMYLELILWALHTERINVFPFKYLPPVDHGDVTDVFKYASEIVQFEPEKNVSQRCGEVKTVVTDDLKEYLAVQKIPGFGTHCFYAFSDNAPISRWNMPPEMNVSLKNEYINESKYWMTLFSKPENTKKEICNINEEIKGVEEDEDLLSEEGEMVESEKSVCPDLFKVETILNNLSFGGRKPPNIRHLVDKDDPECIKRMSTVAEVIDELEEQRSMESDDESIEHKRKSSIKGADADLDQSSRKSSKRDSKGDNTGEEGVAIDSFVLSVDYSKNQPTKSSNAKKDKKNDKGSPPKSQRNVTPQTIPFPDWQTYAMESFDSVDQYNYLENDYQSWVRGYDFNTASKVDDSTMALCGNSSSDDNDYMMMQHHRKTQMNFPSYNNNNEHNRSKSFRNNTTNQANGLNSTNKEKIGTKKQREKVERLNYDHQDSSPLKHYPKNQLSSNQKQTTEAYNDVCSSKPYDQRGFSFESNHKSRPVEMPRSRKKQRLEPNVMYSVPPTGSSNKVSSRSPSRTSLSNSIRSERRLQFSDVHVEPKHHRPNFYAETPLKPCLRKSSDEYPSSHSSDRRYHSYQSRDKRSKDNDYFNHPSHRNSHMNHYARDRQ